MRVGVDLARSLDQELRSRAQDVVGARRSTAASLAVDARHARSSAASRSRSARRRAAASSTRRRRSARAAARAGRARPRTRRAPSSSTARRCPGWTSRRGCSRVPVVAARGIACSSSARRSRTAPRRCAACERVPDRRPACAPARLARRLRLAGAALRPSRRCAGARRRSRRVARASGCRCPPTSDEVARLGETLNEMLARIEDGARARAALRRRREPRAAHAARAAQAPSSSSRCARAGRRTSSRRRSLGRRGDRPPRRGSPTTCWCSPAPSRGGCRSSASRRRRGRCSRRCASASRRAPAEARVTGRSRRRRALVVAGDRLRLEQALGNLVDNAFATAQADHARRGPRETARASCTSATRARGFPPDSSTHAFERFSRGQSTLRRTAAASAWRSSRRSPTHIRASARGKPNGGGADVWITLSLG